MNYGGRMKSVRTAELLSQEKVAEMLNIKRSTFKSYESQNDIIPAKHLVNFCNIFNISIDYIFNFTNEKQYKDNKQEVSKEMAGIRLKNFRKELNLTQSKLADVLNTTHSVIADYERGRYLISTPFLYTICKKYNVSADYLVGKIDEPKYLK